MTEVFLPLHGLAVRKAARAEAVASLLGWPETDVAAALDHATGLQLAMGANGMYMVAPAGAAWLEEQYPIEFAAARRDGALASAYEGFEKVNGHLLALITDWQTIPAGDARVPNEHDDADYDRRIIDRLGDLHDRAAVVVGRCAGSEPRIGRYLERLDLAYDRILAGEVDHVSGVQVESYHTIWYELHEDLLRMLGRTRQE